MTQHTTRISLLLIIATLFITTNARETNDGYWFHAASCIKIGDSGCTKNNECCGLNAQCNDGVCAHYNANGEHSLLEYKESGESLFVKLDHVDPDGYLTLILLAIFICLVITIVSCWIHLFVYDKDDPDEDEDELSTLHDIDWEMIMSEIQKNESEKQCNEQAIARYCE
eukprot:282185_1